MCAELFRIPSHHDGKNKAKKIRSPWLALSFVSFPPITRVPVQERRTSLLSSPQGSRDQQEGTGNNSGAEQQTGLHQTGLGQKTTKKTIPNARVGVSLPRVGVPSLGLR